jgi:hypothetical protein
MPMLFACFNKLLLGYVRFQLVEKLSTACWQLVTRLLTQRTCCKLFKEVFFLLHFNNLLTSCEWQSCSNLINDSIVTTCWQDYSPVQSSEFSLTRKLDNCTKILLWFWQAKGGLDMKYMFNNIPCTRESKLVKENLYRTNEKVNLSRKTCIVHTRR